MSHQGRFPSPSCVFLDGDQQMRDGCFLLPGEDAPERVVFNGLQKADWGNLKTQVARDHADVVDACSGVMTYASHRERRLLVE
jgi:hypothetical protein